VKNFPLETFFCFTVPNVQYCTKAENIFWGNQSWEFKTGIKKTGVDDREEIQCATKFHKDDILPFFLRPHNSSLAFP
jgi:hypothetical protein